MADFRGADLTGANLNYASLPLWCGSLGIKTDKRIIAQLLYHVCSIDCGDEEFIGIRNNMLDFVNKFHLIGNGCDKLEPIIKNS
jgi:hypothetical protein